MKSPVWCKWLLLLWFTALPAEAGQWLSDSQAIMGTEVSVELWAENEEAGRSAIDAVMAEMHRVDALMSPWREDSELSRLNREASQRWVRISDELFELIETAQWYARLSGGAFDISFASVGQLYDYRAGERPDNARLKALLPSVDWRAIEMDATHSAVHFTRKALRIDLGGIAKGHAVDRGIELLAGRDVEAAIVSAGGDSRVLGQRWNRPWMIGIRNPRGEREDYAVMLPLIDSAISTSGDYERFFIADGERVHHIISPRTGRSASGVQSVSVLAPHAVDSDALSTTVFVLGVEQGLRLVNSLPGIDAVIIDAAGKLHYSDELLLEASG